MFPVQLQLPSQLVVSISQPGSLVIFQSSQYGAEFNRYTASELIKVSVALIHSAPAFSTRLRCSEKRGAAREAAPLLSRPIN